MKEYHKINSIFKRNMELPNKPFIEGDWAEPEFEYLQNNRWEWTEKIDGTNIRVMFDGNKVFFGGKSDNAQIPANLVKVLQDKFLPQIDLFKEKFPDGVCLYGEGFGASIQNGGKYIPGGVDFILFDVLIGTYWLNRESVNEIADTLGLRKVDVVGYGTISEAIELVRNGFNSAIGIAKAEGLVIRPTVGLFNRKGERVITKIKTKDFNTTVSNKETKE
jgi:hypothetical protein